MKAKQLIRRLVPRPTELPVPANPPGLSYTSLRFGSGKCPMGLLPTAREKTPIDVGSFSDPLGLSNDDITEFSIWWDKMVDPQKAVEALWA